MKHVRHGSSTVFCNHRRCCPLYSRCCLLSICSHLHISSDTSLCVSFRRALRKSKYHPVRDNGLADSLAGLSPAKGAARDPSSDISRCELSPGSSPQDAALIVTKEFSSRAIALAIAPSGRLLALLRLTLYHRRFNSREPRRSCAFRAR